MNKEELREIIDNHKKWINNENGGIRAYLRGADLRDAYLRGADLRGADLRNADLRNADLSDADLSDADLRGADLSGADLSGADLRGADLSGADLSGTDLRGADLSDADLRGADLSDADLRGADLSGADLSGADLRNANLENVVGLIKTIGVEQGNYYWKRFDYIKTDAGIIKLCNNGYIFKIGINTLKDGEIFADDERVLCSYPGFHFASRSWCALYYSERKYEAKIQIPKDAKINEPWATDGKASADKIKIVQVFDTKTGKDVTSYFRKHNND